VKVTIFGGSGFLGSHVADHLSEVGHEVTIFDHAESRWLRDDQRMVVGDVLDREAVRTAVEGAGAVYNYAAIADLNEAIAA
jgi:UDP-glucose 4-epimerase